MIEFTEGELTSSRKISQRFLQELQDLRQKLVVKKREKSEIRREIEKLEFQTDLINSRIVDLIKMGFRVSRGKLFAELKIKEIMPRLAWKQIFIKFVPNGDKKAEKLMSERETEKIDYVELLRRE